eukprot:gnl/TRDRNA2_/TRDRNA2_177016_c0_seq1.p1 gnl/TRDRNA2_/TRDRNA2_177016_c0~~gnl/TRDRNA2_/TRDRNA2_177016_c0_seq1.p1  ORF type:complete len:1155 (-),score=236.24 gnl/TRDRNA2_/TRDRNA2_177016_c0_seq1:118-3582(-)
MPSHAIEVVGPGGKGNLAHLLISAGGPDKLLAAAGDDAVMSQMIAAASTALSFNSTRLPVPAFHAPLAAASLPNMVVPPPMPVPQPPPSAPVVVMPAPKAPQPSPTPPKTNKALEKSKALQELEKLKVDTMYDMVRDVHVVAGDLTASCKLLYLTNSMAGHIMNRQEQDESIMTKVRERLGLKEPKTVIRLMPSHFGGAYWRTFRYWKGRFPTKGRPPEITPKDGEATEHQLLLLAKDIILPLAIKTNALIIGGESCSLTAAFTRVAAPFQRQMGDDCPFDILLFIRACFFELESGSAGSLAYHVRKQIKPWEKEQESFKTALGNRYGDDQAFWPHEDMFSGEYRCIMFEGLSKEGRVGLSDDLCFNFQSQFIATLANLCPVIGLMTHGFDRMTYLPTVQDHCEHRGLPLMLLDSRKRDPVLPGDDANGVTMKELQKEVEKTSAGLHARGSGDDDDLHPLSDQYSTSLIAFVKGELNAKYRSKFSAENDGSDQQKMWLYEAIMKQKEAKAREQNVSTSTSKDDRTTENLENDLIEATNMIMSYVGKELEWEAKFNQARCQKAIEDVQNSTDWPKFKERVDKNWLKIRGCCFHDYKKLRELCENESWCKLEMLPMDSINGRHKLVIDAKKAEEMNEPLEASMEKVLNVVNGAFAICKKYDALGKTEKSYVAKHDIWMAVYDVLKSPNVHTGNLHNLRGCEKRLFSLAQIDRLPSENKTETLILLRRAWTTVDVFHASAFIYKWSAKVLYFFLLLLGTAVVTVTTLGSIEPDLMSAQTQSNLLLGLALGSTFVTGWVTIIDPHKKWMQLRGGALTLESEIWKFRCRIGEYMGSDLSSIGRDQEERKAQELFWKMMQAVQSQVAQNGGLKDTSFYATPMSTDDIYEDKEERSLMEKSSKIGTEEDEVPKALTRSVEAGSKQLTKLDKVAKKNEMAGRSVAQRRINNLQQAHFLHGQYKEMQAGTALGPLGTFLKRFQPTALPPRPGPGCDNYHSPTTPHEYIRWRLVPALHFYQKRIPWYAWKRKLFQGFLLMASIVSSILAAIGFAPWTAIIAATASMVTAWQEFTATNKKLERYSGVAGSLCNVLMEWQALPEVEQLNMRRISNLVEETEHLISSEHAAWLSDAQKANKMAAEAQDKKGEEGEGQEKNAKKGEHT